MEAVRNPVFRVTYEGKNITEVISKYLESIDYTDNTADNSDEISITIDNTDHRWTNEWYPQKKDKVKLEIGYDDTLMDCGTFTVDELEASGPPHMFKIRALAAGVSSPLRTKNSRAYEKQTLRKIAEAVASKYGYTVEGEILNINIERVTQNRETDLAFLKRVAGEYGHLFSVRDNKLVFTSIFQIEKGQPVFTLNRAQVSRYSMKDQTVSTFKQATVKYHNPSEDETYFAGVGTEDSETLDSGSEDELVLNVRAENPQQAEAKGKAAMKANQKTKTANIDVYGNPLLVAGNNIELTGFGEMSGKWHIKKSTHRITRAGYTTGIELEKVQPVPAGTGAKSKKTEVKQGDFIYVSGSLSQAGQGAGGTTSGRSMRAGENAKPLK